jgi:geranylgeranyl diphosphate synthase, type II
VATSSSTPAAARGRRPSRATRSEALTGGPSAALETRRRLVEAALDAALPPESSWPSTIHRAARYSLFAGGKRIRPLLVLAAGEAVGGATEALMPLACAVEMIHTYSLIHDDLPAMDNDDLRRGKPTSHKVFGEAMAILAGDALLTRAFHVLLEVAPGTPADDVRRRLRAAAILGDAAGTSGLIGGQVADLEAEGRDDVTLPDLERLHRAKTGALLGACVLGGGVLGGAGEADLGRLAQFGEAIGLGFQVVDDILDATEGADRLGKTAGKDAAAGKATYVRLMGLEGARAIAARLLAEARAAIAPLGERGALLDALATLIVERHA